MDEDKAGRILLENWRANTRIEALPEALRPRSRAAGYAIAAALAKASGQPVAGWKIAATSKAGQKHINVPGPLGARILQDRLLTPGAAVPLGDNIMKVVEAEFAFSFGQAMPARAEAYSQEETAAAVAALHLSIEVPDSRYKDFTKVGADQLIADTACASWLVLGPPVAVEWRKLDLARHVVVGFRNGVEVSRGTGEAVLGGPLIALTWLVNEASAYCGGISAGQFVTTGTCIAPFAIAPGDALRMDYGVLGSIEASVT